MNGNTETTDAAGTEVEAKVLKDALDERIEKERVRQEKLKASGEGIKTEKEEDEDTSKITVDRDYIHSLREEAKTYRKQLEGVKEDFGQIQSLLKQHYGVDSAQGLQEKLAETKRVRENEEDDKLSKVDLSEKKRAQLEKEKEEQKIAFEQERNDLVSQRNKIIIENSLIQAAVANDVINPKQLLRLLHQEFYVDDRDLKPKYQTSEGIEMTLDDRVKAFLEEQDNWNLVRGRMTVSGGSQTAIGGPARPIFTKDELKIMRNENPAEYKRRQPEIQRAYAEGRVR